MLPIIPLSITNSLLVLLEGKALLLNWGVTSFGSLPAPLSLAALQGCDFRARGPIVPPALSNKLNSLSSLIPLGERFFQSSAHLCLPPFCRAFALFLLPSAGIFFSPYLTPLRSPHRWHYSNPHINSNKKTNAFGQACHHFWVSKALNFLGRQLRAPGNITALPDPPRKHQLPTLLASADNVISLPQPPVVPRE